MIQYLSLFSGIGAFEKALDNLKIPYNLVNYCEIDKYASKSYSAVHNVSEELNLGDITKVDTSKLPHIDMISYGFPCQDISISGKMRGLFNEDGTQTRSGLFFEALRIIEDTKPKVAIAENVKNLTSKKFSEQFKIALESLEAAGYNNYWEILNAKDYGIPQNRERVFIVSIRKDIDNGFFKFPEPFELKLRLKDILETVVDEKYHLSSIAIEKMIYCGYGQQYEKDTKPQIKVVGLLDIKGNEQVRRVYAESGISPTLNTMQGGNRQPKVLLNETVKTECTEIVEEFIKNNNKNADHQQDLLQHKNDICRCIPAGTHGSTPHLLKTIVNNNPLKIRKLTPLECWRLQAFDDEDFYRAEKVNSNTQLYKQAGNSICVRVAERLFEKVMEVVFFD